MVLLLETLALLALLGLLGILGFGLLWPCKNLAPSAFWVWNDAFLKTNTQILQIFWTILYQFKQQFKTSQEK